VSLFFFFNPVGFFKIIFNIIYSVLCESYVFRFFFNANKITF